MLLGRARNVARVPIGTRALLEAWEAGRTIRPHRCEPAGTLYGGLSAGCD